MKTKCMSCGGSMKKMQSGGTTTKRIIKKSTGGMYGIPQENLGPSSMKKGGATKTTKFAALAPPYNKATFADRIVGAKKSAKKKKYGIGGPITHLGNTPQESTATENTPAVGKNKVKKKLIKNK